MRRIIPEADAPKTDTHAGQSKKDEAPKDKTPAGDKKVKIPTVVLGGKRNW